MTTLTHEQIQENIDHNIQQNNPSTGRELQDQSDWPIMQIGMKTWEQKIIENTPIYKDVKIPEMTKTEPRQQVKQPTLSAQDFMARRK